MGTEELLLELISAVKELSPEVWRIFLQQVKVMIYNHFVWGGICLLVCIADLVGFRFAFKMEKEDNRDRHYPDWTFSLLTGVTSVVFLILVVVLVSGGFYRMFNPEYYAIQMLLANVGQ